MRRMHQPAVLALSVALVALLACLRTTPVHGQPVATWIQLTIDDATAPASGFCDHVAFDEPLHARLIMAGGDTGDGDSLPGLWALDYSQSLTSPRWIDLNATASDGSDLTLGAGATGALHSLSRTSAGELLLVGGHDLDHQNEYNTTFAVSTAVPNTTDTTSWSQLTVPTPFGGLAWATADFADANRTIVLMYGGTSNDGIDTGDLYLFNLTAPELGWQNISDRTSGDRPPPLSGTRLRLDLPRQQLVLMGGYGCTTNGASGLSSRGCFSNSVWLLSLNASTHYKWRLIADPNPGLLSTWPSARAWHSTIVYQSQLWVFGGQYIDLSSTTYYYNDIAVFNLESEQWDAVTIYGSTPPVMWSQTSSLVYDPRSGEPHMLVMGGCTGTSYYNSVYGLKLNKAIQPNNCEASGDGLAGAIAGRPSWFLIQTKDYAVVNDSVEFGDPLSWGVSLVFDVFMIGQVGSVTSRIDNIITELGGGVYNVSYTAVGGSSSCSSESSVAAVSIAISLNHTPIPNSPFTVPVIPATLTAAKSVVLGVNEAVENKYSTFFVHPADEYGNLAHTPQDTARVSVLVDSAQPNSLVVSANGDGSYAVTYRAPNIAVYTLSVSFDDTFIPGSPFTIAPFSNLDVSDGQQLAIQLITALSSVGVVLAVLVLMKFRAQPVFKASSPTFLLLILSGCQLALVSNFIPAPTEPSSTSILCTSVSWPLSIGFTLSVTSLVMKTWRISRIFNAKKIKVRVLRDLHIMIPVLAAVVADVIFNVVWMGVDPLRPVDEVSANNPLVHYTSCASEHMLVWEALSFVPKGLLLIYGVILGSQVRNVPSAFNESKWIGLAIYNIAFCSIVLLAMLLLLSSAPASIYLVRGVVVDWCVLVTAALMIVPKVLSFYGYLIDSQVSEGPRQVHMREGPVNTSVLSMSTDSPANDSSSSNGQRKRSTKTYYTYATPSAATRQIVSASPIRVAPSPTPSGNGNALLKNILSPSTLSIKSMSPAINGTRPLNSARVPSQARQSASRTAISSINTKAALPAVNAVVDRRTSTDEAPDMDDAAPTSSQSHNSAQCRAAPSLAPYHSSSAVVGDSAPAPSHLLEMVSP